MSCKKTNKNFSGDFTIHDFADSNFVSFRPKKSNTTPKVMQTAEVDWEWDDNSEDEIELVDEDNGDGTKIIVVKRKTKPNRQHFDKTILESPGIEYPVAVWFLISEHIKPEDVGRFAGICKGSLFVTTFAKFWNDLYKRHCKPTSALLPERLKPESMGRRYCLRSLVIRSLYYTYSPLIHRHENQQFCTPQELLKWRCLTMWYQRYKHQWAFYFKMKHVAHSFRSRSNPPPKRNLFTLLDDINANPEDGSRVLKVICGSFTETQPVMGMVLKLIQTSLTPNMRNHRLTLGFSSGLQDKPECTVVLDTVVKMKVMNWWDPLYPHSPEYLPFPTLSHSTSFNCTFNI